MKTMKTQKSNFRRLIVLLVMLIAITFSAEAMAKPDSTKALIKQAAAAFDKDDYDTALAKFNQAYEQEPKVSILYNIGRVYEKKADYATAIDYYNRYINSPGCDEEARDDAYQRIQTISKFIKGGKSGAKTNSKSGAKATLPAGGCIDINTASAEELDILDGVGLATANKIIAGRPYATLDEVATKVKGISIKTVDKMRTQVCPISGAAAAPKAAPEVKAAPVPKAAPEIKEAKPSTDDKKADKKATPKANAPADLDI